MRTFTKDEYILQIRDRYCHATRAERQMILKEVCGMFGYHRKYAKKLKAKFKTLNPYESC